MAFFEMIKYHSQEYPADVPLRIEEIAAHFDITSVGGQLKRSLHTEYSYGKRKLNSALISQYPEIVSAQKDGIPQLWKNEMWAAQFANFIIFLSGNEPPAVIEIHPPFNDYTDIASFVRAYSVFEEKIKERFPDVEILIENRCGSVYRGGKFLISKVQSVSALCEAIDKTGLHLRIAYDIPQIYTAHNAKTEAEYVELLNDTKELRQFIGGVHMWGKRLSDTGRRVSHCGDLNSYFESAGVKAQFLRAFADCFDDGIVRKMVLEVNSGNDDLQSIVADLKSIGTRFV